MIYKEEKIKCDVCKKEREVPSRALWAYRTNDAKKWFCSYGCSRQYDKMLAEKGIRKQKNGVKRPESNLSDRDSAEYKLAIAYLNELRPGTVVSLKDMWEHVFDKSVYTYTRMARDHICNFLRMQPDYIPNEIIDVNGNMKSVSYRKLDIKSALERMNQYEVLRNGTS